MALRSSPPRFAVMTLDLDLDALTLVASHSLFAQLVLISCERKA